MTDLIRIQPATARRRAFARWATAQELKVRTVGINTFAVPAPLFVEAPEDVLVGALIDGHRYVSPEEDAREGRAAPGELLGVATPEGFSQTGTGPHTGAVPDEEIPDEAPDETGMFGCDLCPREFITERGRDSHRRQVHPED